MNNKATLLRDIQTSGIVAVVRVDSVEHAIGATRALLRGGLRAIEITFTLSAAAQAISQLAREAKAGNLEGDLLLGAGTVTSRDQAEAAIQSGAQFLISPCVVTEVIHTAQEHDIAMLPGAMTPTEIWTAHALGGDIIKVFPATRLGPQYLADIRGPMPHIPLMPTGGIDASNAADWIKAGAVALGVGGKLVDRAAIAAGEWDTLTQRARELVQAVQNARQG